MSKTIVITGATDGIGLATAKMMVTMGHQLLIHGRNEEKVNRVIKSLKDLNSELDIHGFVADFSSMTQVKAMAQEILRNHKHIDVLINNAGIYVTKDLVTEDGLDTRFAVNTYAPYLLTKLLLTAMGDTSRVVNLSSAAQSSVDIAAMCQRQVMSDDQAYAQSKLAITMWSIHMANEFKSKGHGPSVVAVNPKSFLGSKMVKEAYGSEGHDIRIGGDILCRASLSEEFEGASGKYFDNDRGVFAMPHPDAMDEALRDELVEAIEKTLKGFI